MRKKIVKKFLSCLLIVGVVCAMPISKVFADTLFNMMYRAAAAMSAYEIEEQHIMDRIELATQPRPVPTPSPTPAPMPKPVTHKNLLTFAIQSYIEHGTVHKMSDETIHRSNLPLTVLSWMTGYGDITGVSIDGVPIKSALVGKCEFGNKDISDACTEFITLDESVIRSLNDGRHRIVVSCTGPSDSGYVTYTDDFTFYLAN